MTYLGYLVSNVESHGELVMAGHTQTGRGQDLGWTRVESGSGFIRRSGLLCATIVIGISRLIADESTVVCALFD